MTEHTAPNSPPPRANRLGQVPTSIEPVKIRRTGAVGYRANIGTHPLRSYRTFEQRKDAEAFLESRKHIWQYMQTVLARGDGR